jgi:hypothetical protein
MFERDALAWVKDTLLLQDFWWVGFWLAGGLN